MTDIIIGELQLPLSKAMKMSLNEIIIMQLGMMRKEERQLQQTRLIMWEIRTKYVKKGKTIEPSDIFKLSCDNNTKKPERMTKDLFLKLIEQSKTEN